MGSQNSEVEMREDLILAFLPMVAIIVGSAMIVSLVFMGTRMRTRRVERMTELQNRVLDKFGTATEFIQFLSTPEGRLWMTASTESRTHQADRILGSVRWGMITAAIGGAFVLLATIEERDMIIPGILIGSVGVGFLAHAYLATRLARRWGMMPKAHDEGGEE